MLRLFLIVLLSLCSLPALAQGSSLERFQTYVRTTQAASADFDQKVYDRTGKLVQESKGNFAFLRPGRFRWTYAKPNPQLIVGDGERVWVYDEDLKQVTVRRLAKALGSSPAALLAGAADIDKALKLGLNHPMGPFEMIDLVGLDTRLSILNFLHKTLGEKYRPCPLLVKYVKAGRLGKKVGKGVYEYGN